MKSSASELGLRNHDGDAKDNADEELSLCFTYYSRGTQVIYFVYH